jgi:hypothetical protein
MRKGRRQRGKGRKRQGRRVSVKVGRGMEKWRRGVKEE